MAKAFTESGKEQIRQNLLKKGREYFTRYGLRKTSVDELARAAGIAKGSFYKFFDSKEALFLAVHEASEGKLREDLMHRLAELENPADKLRLFLKSAFLIMGEDPLLATVFGKGGIEAVSEFLSSSKYEVHYRHSIAFMNELIRQWQKEGVIRQQLDADVAGNMIASSFFIFLQRNTLGEEMYDRVTDMLIDSLVKYLAVDAGVIK